MSGTFTVIAKNFANLFYPRTCASCGKGAGPSGDHAVCASCLSKIMKNNHPYLNVYKGSKVYSACIYEGVLKELVLLFKYRSKIYLSGVLSDLMVSAVKEAAGIVEGIDMITFVPLSSRRLWQRDFNQSKVLASRIAREFTIALADTLDKTLSTRHQNELTRQERLTNLRGAFRARKDVGLEGKKLLLVDDVITTGATLSECVKELLDAGAAEVRCFTLARGL